ncbi:hypothetical protein MNBD_CHLOROFLEXI01-1846 [hydrothermal vent metagenome]|uniref:Effector-associated domain-containing protein n=1 Tax=hydrothermal vent metagenome TaxID=652676 RepID=A0A3B0VHJ8_9ZZZZ
MNREELHNLIDQRFNLEELKTLCFNLHVDYDSLPSEGKRAKIRELILGFERIDKINELVEKCQEMRPSVSWPNSAKNPQSLSQTEAMIPKSTQHFSAPKRINEPQKQLWIIILVASPIIGLVGIFYAFTPVIFLVLMLSLQVIIGLKINVLSEIRVFAPASAIIAIISMSLFGSTTSLDVGDIQRILGA